MNGKRLLTLEEYKEIIKSFPLYLQNNLIGRGGLMAPDVNDILVPINTHGKYVQCLPGPDLNALLYRGESENWNECSPSFNRLGSPVLKIIERCKLFQFYNFLEGHPGIKEMKSSLRICGLSPYLNFESLAQHYGFKTSFLDLTFSLDVAKYFATHDSCGKARIGEWAYIYTGRIYDLLDKNLLFLGLTPFSHPYAQKAFGVRLNQGQNFHDFQSIQVERFKVTEETVKDLSKNLSENYFKEAYPFDMVAHIAKKIREHKGIYKVHFFRAYIEGGYKEPYRDICDEVIKEGFLLEERNQVVTSDFELKILGEEWKMLKNNYLKNLKIRKVSSMSF